MDSEGCSSILVESTAAMLMFMKVGSSMDFQKELEEKLAKMARFTLASLDLALKMGKG